MKRCFLWAPLLIVQLLLTPLPIVNQAALGEIPFPSLEGLEPAVSAQLAEMRDLLVAAGDEPLIDSDHLAGAYGELGRLYHAYNFFDAADACYVNARMLAPDDFRWSYYLAALRRSSGDLDRAVASYEETLALQPDYVPALVALAEILNDQGLFPAAEPLLNRALEIAPSSAAAMTALGEISLSRREFDDAVLRFETAIAWAPQANRLHYPLALAYRGLGDTANARLHLELRGAVGVRPADPLLDELVDLQVGESVHLLRGRRAFRAGRYEDAAREFRTATDAAPRSARARINLSAALAALGHNDEAISRLEDALSLEPDNATAHFNLATLLTAAGRPDEAVAHLGATVRLAPEDTEAQLNLAWLLAAEGRHDAALELLERTVARQSDRRATQALSRYLASCSAPCERNEGRALELALDDFQSLRSSFHAATVALAFASLGRCQEAARWQNTALSAAIDDRPLEAVRALREDFLRYSAGPPCAPLKPAGWQ